MKHTAKQFEIEAVQIQRADGRPLHNGYLWPTEDWWLGHEHRHFDTRWHFGYVALLDGRFCVDGSVWHIQENKDLHGRQNNFLTREAAIRASCARMIETMRAAREWDHWHGGMQGKQLEFAINWALEKCYTACRPTNSSTHNSLTLKLLRKPRRVTIAKPPPPPPPPPRIQTKVRADDWSTL